jgi:glycerophosphoryl diester phosphodiesterase
VRSFYKVAHRGWHRFHVENTMDAFRAAYMAGCHMVEFDVQLSRDGVPVVFHDDDCMRLAGRRGYVFDMDWSELQSLPLPGTGRPGGDASYRIPSLGQFLAEFGSRPFYLELKVPDAVASNDDYVRMLAETCARMVRDASPHPDTFLASFHGGILRRLSKDGLFPVLAGIFENYERFREVHSGADAETAAAIRHFSVSWEVFQRYARESASVSERAARLSKGGRLSEVDLLALPEAVIPDPGLFLIWDIAGMADFRAALERGVLGLVSDDVENLVNLSPPASG